MDSNDKRQVIDILKAGEKIGELLELDKVPTFNMTWRELRLDIPGGGDCYPLIDVLEKMAELIALSVRQTATVKNDWAYDEDCAPEKKVTKKKMGRPKKKIEGSKMIGAHVPDHRKNFVRRQNMRFFLGVPRAQGKQTVSLWWHCV
jgi:hypothetical protein